MQASVVNEEFSTCGLTLGGEAMKEVLLFLHRQDDPEAALQSLLATLQAATRACGAPAGGSRAWARQAS